MTIIPFAEVVEAVLIVDDEPTVRALVMTAIEAANSVGNL
jgi:hypothetical protein